MRRSITFITALKQGEREKMFEHQPKIIMIIVGKVTFAYGHRLKFQVQSATSRKDKNLYYAK